MDRRSLTRALLWGLLAGAVLAVAVGAWMTRPVREAPPVLGEVPPFDLVGADGEPVSREDLLGSPWIADFVFTRCPASCPVMSRRMAALDGALPERVGLVSFTVDPVHDTPEELARYAERYDASPRWRFLTGDPIELRHLSQQGFKLAVAPAQPDEEGNPPPEPILHSTRFVLVDRSGGIRGYYDAFDPEAMARLEADLELLL